MPFTGCLRSLTSCLWPQFPPLRGGVGLAVLRGLPALAWVKPISRPSVHAHHPLILPRQRGPSTRPQAAPATAPLGRLPDSPALACPPGPRGLCYRQGERVPLPSPLFRAMQREVRRRANSPRHTRPVNKQATKTTRKDYETQIQGKRPLRACPGQGAAKLGQARGSEPARPRTIFVLSGGWGLMKSQLHFTKTLSP